MPGLIPFSHPLSGQPFGTALELCLLLVVFCWVAPLFARGHGWLDRLWSLCPPVYCLLVAAGAGFDSARINLMTALVLIWAVRLTCNFARKGGYRKGDEDYRWAAMQERISPLWFQLLNISFLIPSQLLLMWLFTSPVHQAWLSRGTPLGWLDGLAAALFVAFFVVEVIGDEQMWAFQQDKKRRIAAGEDVAQPFINHGPLPLQPASEPPVRDGHVVRLLSLRRVGIGDVAALDRPRLHPAHRAVPRCDPVDGIDLREQVPGLRGVPGEDPDAGAAAGAPPLAAIRRLRAPGYGRSGT